MFGLIAQNNPRQFSVLVAIQASARRNPNAAGPARTNCVDVTRIEAVLGREACEPLLAIAEQASRRADPNCPFIVFGQGAAVVVDHLGMTLAGEDRELEAIETGQPHFRAEPDVTIMGLDQRIDLG